MYNNLLFSLFFKDTLMLTILFILFPVIIKWLIYLSIFPLNCKFERRNYQNRKEDN